ncbi:E3 SUMO-protein ligase ZBED1-like [Clavelina lepadiformis]|uniref:E3 SUMO-protein ligase ZBED1-like n=1 Tax=Clavelina lepadiformis TaxID=159417 RepID=UPI0040425BA5
MSTSRGRKKSSSVWEHFSKPDEKNRVVCRHCKGILSYCNSTGSLLKHLKTKHLFLNISGIEGSLSASANNNSGESSKQSDTVTPHPPAAKKRSHQTLLDGHIHRAFTPTQEAKVTSLIMNVIVGDLRPINLVEGSNFKQLIQFLAPGYDLPGRMTFTRKLDSMLLKCKKKITNILSAANHISFTTDLWSSLRQQSYIGVTAHCLVTKTGQLQTFVIATKQVMDSHTGINIADWIESTLEEYSLSPGQIFAVVSDNGSNMVRACEILNERHNWTHVRCSAHSLQLCIKDACSLPAIKSALAAARHLVQYFKQSHKAAEALRLLQRQQQQGETESGALELVLDVATRWNSTFQMIQRLCHLQWMVRQILSDTTVTSRSKASHLEIRDHHWFLLQGLVEELLPLKVASDFIEGDQYVTTAAIVPLIKGLLSNYSSSSSGSSTSSASVHISAFRQKIKSAIECRFDFKPHYATRVCLHLKSKMISQSKSDTDTTAAIIAPPHNPIPVGHSSVSMMENLFNLGMEEATKGDADDEGADIDTMANNEVSAYLKENSNNTDVLDICLKYLSLPASSAASERCFSSAGLTATVLRSRLTGSHLEALNILHCNKQLLD